MIQVELLPENRLYGASSRPLTGHFDRSGICIFFGLPAGSYTVSVSVPGGVTKRLFVHLDPATQETVTIQAGSALEHRSEPKDMVPMRWLASPEKARKRYLKAAEEYQKADYQGAIRDLQASLEVDSQFAFAYNLQGLALLKMHQPEEAKESFEMAIRADPKFVSPYLNYGQMLLEKNPAQAAEILQQASQKIANNADVFYLARFALNDFDAAEKAARRVLETNGEKYPQTHLLLANVHVQRQEYTKARTELQAYLDRRPTGESADSVRRALGQSATVSTSTAAR